jgi:hypothetical protein
MKHWRWVSEIWYGHPMYALLGSDYLNRKRIRKFLDFLRAQDA